MTSAKVVEPTSAESAFEQLPAELRNEIYRLALTTSDKIVIRRGLVLEIIDGHKRLVRKPVSIIARDGEDASSDEAPAAAQVLGLGLLRTNRMIHDEASPILYHANRFCIYSTDMSDKTFEVFISQIGRKAKLLTKVETRTDDVVTNYQNRVLLMRLDLSTSISLQTIVVKQPGAYGQVEKSVKGTWTALKPLLAFREIEDERLGWRFVGLTTSERISRLQAINFSDAREAFYKPKSDAEANDKLKSLLLKYLHADLRGGGL